MDLKKADTYAYKVEPFDADFKGRLSWEVLGKKFLSAASFHAGARGFNSLEKDGIPYLWVLSRLVFQMKKWPKAGENYSITTWVRSQYRFFTERAFDICDESGKLCGQVLSIWAMINSQTREPADLTSLFGDVFEQYLDPDRFFGVKRTGRIRVANQEAANFRTAYYNDLDTNGHVNSIRYIEYLLDAFPKEKHETQNVERLEMDYCSESYCGDAFGIYLDRQDDDKFLAEIRKPATNAEESPTITCKCAITFSKNKEK